VADRHGEAERLTRLGDTYVATGRPGAPRQVWLRATELRAGLGDPDPADVRSRLTGLDRSARQPLPG
jgi:hypothetical protein